MNDEFDKQVERLLQPFFVSIPGLQNAVAAALRKQAWINDAVYQGMAKEIADLRAENERLKAAQLADMQIKAAKGVFEK